MNRWKAGASALVSAAKAWKLLGTHWFLEKIKHQVHSQIPYYCLCTQLKAPSPGAAANRPITLAPAARRDVFDFFQIMSRESAPSRYEMLARLWFYKKGFTECYIGRTIANGEACSIVWHVSNSDIEWTRTGGLYAKLEMDEIYAENIYVLEKFRGRGLMHAIGRCHEQLGFEQGYRRMYFFVRKDNTASLRSSLRRGHVAVYEFERRHLLGVASNRLIKRFEPPLSVDRLLTPNPDRNELAPQSAAAW